MGRRRSTRGLQGDLETDKNHLIKAVLVCHNETATGVTSDVAGVRKILRRFEPPSPLVRGWCTFCRKPRLSDGRMGGRCYRIGLPERIYASNWPCNCWGQSKSNGCFRNRNHPQRLLLLRQHVANEQTRIFPIHSANDIVAWFARIHRHDER